MTLRKGAGVQPDESLEILVFALGNVHCGIDGGLVGRMLRLDAAEDEGLALHWFHLLLPFGDREVKYRRPLAITLQGTGGEIGLVIDQPYDLRKLSVKAIRPLPPFFARITGVQPFWGATVFGEMVILLVDPYRLLK